MEYFSKILDYYRNKYELYSSCGLDREDSLFLEDTEEFNRYVVENNIGVLFYKIDYPMDIKENGMITRDFNNPKQLIIRCWGQARPVYTIFKNN